MKIEIDDADLVAKLTLAMKDRVISCVYEVGQDRDGSLRKAIEERVYGAMIDAMHADGIQEALRAAFRKGLLEAVERKGATMGNKATAAQAALWTEGK
mgnify:FL=1